MCIRDSLLTANSIPVTRELPRHLIGVRKNKGWNVLVEASDVSFAVCSEEDCINNSVNLFLGLGKPENVNNMMKDLNMCRTNYTDT